MFHHDARGSFKSSTLLQRLEERLEVTG